MITKNEFYDHFRDGKLTMPVSVLRDKSLMDDNGYVSYRDPKLTLDDGVNGVSGTTIRDMDKLRTLISGGITNPIGIKTTKNGKFIIEDGTHRLLAAEELGWENVPVQFVPNSVDDGTGYKFFCRYGGKLIGSVAGSILELRTRLVDKLNQLRPVLAEAAQEVYDDWEEDGSGFGICDEIAEQLATAIGNSREIRDYTIEEGGQDGDDHAYIVVVSGNEAVAVNIPAGVYETGGGYNWKKIPGVTIDPDDVLVYEIDYAGFMGEPHQIDLNLKVHALANSIKRKYNLQKFELYLPKPNLMWLANIEVNSDQRSIGIGSKVLLEVCDFADRHNLIIGLTPEESQRERLEQFYGRFGFEADDDQLDMMRLPSTHESVAGQILRLATKRNPKLWTTKTTSFSLI